LTSQIGTPKGALIAIGDMLDSCAKVQPGQEVLLLAEIEGLYNNMVDQEAISWIQSAVQARGANASVLWIDEKPKVHAWRFTPVAKAAMAGADILINQCFNLTTEEMVEFREYIVEENFIEKNFKMVRNFATTAPLLCTAWAQTPYELLSEIRYQAGIVFKGGLPFKLTDPNGTHLEGNIREPVVTKGIPGGVYGRRRGSYDAYYPWPEWLHTPVQLENTNGIFIFDCMLSWWSRYIGISPYFSKPIELTIKNNRITDIKGGDEAEALRRFLAAMVEHVGEGVYYFDTFHGGIHPQANVGPHQCPNPLMRRIIEHSNSCNLHFHVGSPPPNSKYPYWAHVTGDIRTPTFKVGDTLVYDRGHLTALDHPAVLAIENKYPGRPGVTPEPRSF
jgi:hypothetical protein